MKPRTLVATIPGMVTEEDLRPLRDVSEVDYCERDVISEEELADSCRGCKCLMLNYDVVKNLGEKFYSYDNVQQLTAVSTDITGMDWASPRIAQQFNVTLQHVPFYSTESVAETTLCEVLLHSRQRLASFCDLIMGRDVEGRKGINLLSRPAGVVGVGNIGARVVELLSGVGMDVSVWNRSEKPGYSSKPLQDLFAQSVVICLCMKTVMTGPESNVGIIGEELLSLCNGTIIVNLAGAKLVDNDAMARAIGSGRVTGYTVERSDAALSSALASLEAVHLPPPNAWKSDESLNTLRDTWVKNTIDAIAGKPANVYVE